jgi:precorrin-8X/cobalt-precorrin-8 methylmutase
MDQQTELKIKPEEIEQESFRIIDAELLEQGIRLTGDTAPVIRRVIHTTADFSYVDTLEFSMDAVKLFGGKLLSGARIVTDTEMGKAGINKKKVASLGGEVLSFMADPEVAEEAKKRGLTRAAVSMEHAAKLSGDTIFVIGNAPTALLTLRDLIREGKAHPAGIVGVPVGFVNVVYAKEEIMKVCGEFGIPYIVNAGRKGGSNVSAAVINALLKTL